MKVCPQDMLFVLNIRYLCLTKNSLQSTMSNNEPLHIDIDKVLKQRVPQYHKFMPRFAIAWLKRIIHQDELNHLLRIMAPTPGLEAANSVLRQLDVKAQLQGESNIPAEGRFIFVSNHPLGALDGLTLMSALGKKYAGHIKFLVNDLLMAITPLRPLFLPVNEYGRQSRLQAQEIDKQYQGDNQMIVFPAGMCSRMNEQGLIRDLKWHKFIVTHAIKYKRDIVPIYFDGQNSSFFYRMARWRKRLGLKFNFELIFLPGEMFKSKGHTFTIHFGRPIAWQSLDATQPHAQAQRLRNLVYQLSSTVNNQA